MEAGERRSQIEHMFDWLCDAGQVAGGMSRGEGPTLEQRSAALRRAAVEGQPGRHCWVVEAPGHPGRWAGLLVEWRRAATGWEGRVVYAIPEPARSGSRLIERWLPAGCLEASGL